MPLQDKPTRSCFGTGDPVHFPYRRQTLNGIIVRTNPKTALVRQGNKLFRIPYERLLGDLETMAKRRRRVHELQQYASTLLKRYSLDAWRFRMDHSTRRAGCCRYRDRVISISYDLAVNGSDQDIHETLLHEIAHALVGKKHGHDAVWKSLAKQIGCSGSRTHAMNFSPPRWHVRCENNCWSHTAQKRSHRLVCRECGGKPVYTIALSGRVEQPHDIPD